MGQEGLRHRLHQPGYVFQHGFACWEPPGRFCGGGNGHQTQDSSRDKDQGLVDSDGGCCGRGCLFVVVVVLSSLWSPCPCWCWHGCHAGGQHWLLGLQLALAWAVATEAGLSCCWVVLHGSCLGWLLFLCMRLALLLSCGSCPGHGWLLLWVLAIQLLSAHCTHHWRLGLGCSGSHSGSPVLIIYAWYAGIRVAPGLRLHHMEWREGMEWHWRWL